MARRKKAQAVSVSMTQLGLFDAATMNGLEPAISKADYEIAVAAC